MRTTLTGLVLSIALPALAAEPQRFGKPLEGLAPKPLADVLAKPEAGKLVALEGTIARVCQNRGCWLELKQGDASVHVTFEGYSFFVPKDSAGRRVALEGKVMVEKPGPDEIRHLEAEGARSAAAAVFIEARGVEIR